MPDLAEKRVPGSLSAIWEAELDEAAVSVECTASGRWAAAASASGAVYLFDAETGRQERRWDAHRVAANSVAWHPHEDLLASAGQDGKVALWTPEADLPNRTLALG